MSYFIHSLFLKGCHFKNVLNILNTIDIKTNNL